MVMCVVALAVDVHGHCQRMDSLNKSAAAFMTSAAHSEAEVANTLRYTKLAKVVTAAQGTADKAKVRSHATPP
jgi:hypothetical protein